MGVAIVNMPGGEIFTSLQSGAIDATEWIGPYNDLAFGLHQPPTITIIQAGTSRR